MCCQHDPGDIWDQTSSVVWVCPCRHSVLCTRREAPVAISLRPHQTHREPSRPGRGCRGDVYWRILVARHVVIFHPAPVGASVPPGGCSSAHALKLIMFSGERQAGRQADGGVSAGTSVHAALRMTTATSLQRHVHVTDAFFWSRARRQLCMDDK